VSTQAITIYSIVSRQWQIKLKWKKDRKKHGKSISSAYAGGNKVCTIKRA
jgi:hypothetical protein